MTEKECFMARLDEKIAAEGIKDIKFMVQVRHTLTEDEFFSAANQFDDAATKSRVAVNLADIDVVEPEPSGLLD